jgi:hypothetical protein
MSNEQNPVLPEDPSEAQPGRGAPGDNHYGVQMSQTIAVNSPDERIPANTNPELSEKQVNALREQEDSSDLHTTDGYVIDESGQLNNFAVEPPMYVEEKKSS